MANRDQELGPELQCPEISSSGIPLGLELEQEMFDPPEHWWVPRPWVPAQGRKRRRAQLGWEEEETEEEEEKEEGDDKDYNSRPGLFDILTRDLFAGEEHEEEEEEEEEGDDNDNSCPGLFDILTRDLFAGEEQQEGREEEGPCRRPRKLRRLQPREVLPEYHIAFARLLTDPVVRRFLAWDQHLEVSDKYQLAMVVAYFSRFGLFGWQLRRIHFFLALYLASNMEEEHQEARETLFALLYGRSILQLPHFHRQRLMLLRSMCGWTMVSRDQCEEIQAFDPDLWVWGRDRASLT